MLDLSYTHNWIAYDVVNDKRHPNKSDDAPIKHRRGPNQYTHEYATLWDLRTSSSKIFLVGTFPESTMVSVLLGLTAFSRIDDRTVLCWPSAPMIKSVSRTVPSIKCTDGLSHNGEDDELSEPSEGLEGQGGSAKATLVSNITRAPALTTAAYKISCRSLNCVRPS